MQRSEGEGLNGGGTDLSMLGEERYIQNDRLKLMMMASFQCLQSSVSFLNQSKPKVETCSYIIFERLHFSVSTCMQSPLGTRTTRHREQQYGLRI